MYAIIHSKAGKGDTKLYNVDFVGVKEDEEGIVKNYAVRTPDGTLCTAIFNCFNCCYYADDIWGTLTEEEIRRDYLPF